MAEVAEVDLLTTTTLPSVEGGEVVDVSPKNDGVFGDFLQGQDNVEIDTQQFSLEMVEPTSSISGGGQELIDINAAENLPAFAMVTVNGNIADSSNVAHYGKVVGMTTIAVLSGNIASLVDDDEVTNPLWSWSAGQKLFLNGTSLSTTPPSSGFCQMVAVARNNTTVVMRIEIPILL